MVRGLPAAEGGLDAAVHAIILVTAKGDSRDIVAGLNAAATNT